MRIDYNKLFFRDTSILEFTTTDTGKTYKAYVAGVFSQTFGVFSYELGVYHSDWMDIYNNLEYAEVKKDTLDRWSDGIDRWSDGKGVVKTRTAECPISIAVPVNAYTIENIPGKVSHFRQKRDAEFENRFFDCLESRGIIEPRQQGNLRALQICIEWDEVEAIDQKCNSVQADTSIFSKIDID